MHGFLGPNGSGKVTTIRELLGLVSADPGVEEIRLLDRPVPEGLADAIGPSALWLRRRCSSPGSPPG
jgi:ABC-type multidrug transport system ATPase subunit